MAGKKEQASMQELMQKSADELGRDAERQRAELGRARYQLASGRLAKTHTLGAARRRLARTLTAQSLRRGDGGQGQGAET